MTRIRHVIGAATAAMLLTACVNEPSTIASDDPPTTDQSSSAESTPVSTTTTTPTTTTEPTEYDLYTALMTKRRIPIREGQSGTYAADVSTCSKLRDGTLDTWNLSTREGVRAQNENGLRLTVMVPLLCPDMQPAIDAARSGALTQTGIRDGKYLVSETPLPDSQTVQPGTWTTNAAVSDCYWERSDAQGNIIDNNFVSIAPPITVTIANSDAGFTSSNCGEWTRAT